MRVYIYIYMSYIYIYILGYCSGVRVWASIEGFGFGVRGVGLRVSFMGGGGLYDS